MIQQLKFTFPALVLLLHCNVFSQPGNKLEVFSLSENFKMGAMGGSSGDCIEKWTFGTANNERVVINLWVDLNQIPKQLKILLWNNTQIRCEYDLLPDLESEFLKPAVSPRSLKSQQVIVELFRFGNFKTLQDSFENKYPSLDVIFLPIILGDFAWSCDSLQLSYNCTDSTSRSNGPVILNIQSEIGKGTELVPLFTNGVSSIYGHAMAATARNMIPYLEVSEVYIQKLKSQNRASRTDILKLKRSIKNLRRTLERVITFTNDIDSIAQNIDTIISFNFDKELESLSKVQMEYLIYHLRGLNFYLQNQTLRNLTKTTKV
ncbi:MAG: hypothetical protein IPL46_29115 [Saprospiraceae bacterium]|nr:hypothetical protein [Saprospiraceae bacterium]